MKRSLSLLLALVMLIGILPFQVFADVESAELETKIEETEERAEEKNPLVQEDKEENELQIGDEIKGVPVGEGEVTYPLTIKMYSAADKKFVDKTFNSPDDKLGQWYKNAGRSDWSYKTFRRIFYGWSTDPKFSEYPNDDKIEATDKIYRDIETISAVEGLSSETVLYPVISPWYHETSPNLKEDLIKFVQMFENIGGEFYINYEMDNNEINPVDVDKIIPDALIKKDEPAKGEPISEKRLVTSYYDPDKEFYGVQAISEFKFNDLRIPFLLTENPFHVIKSAKGITDFSGEKPEGYSYEDLVVELDKKMEVAENQKNWTFESSTFIVSDVLDENYNSLNSTIALPSEDSLVTTFSFSNPEKLNKFIIRTTPRTDNQLIVKGSELLKPMILKTGDTENIKIKKDYALELAENKELESINKGSINGSVAINEFYFLVLYSYLNSQGYDTSIRPNTPISLLESKNTMNFDFAIPYARFDKNTNAFGDTGEQNLGYSKFVVNKAMDSDGFDKDTKPNKDINQAGEAFISDEDYKVEETKLTLNGKEYTFKGWNTKADGKGKFVNKDTVISLEDLNQKDNDRVKEDITLYAIWESKEEPKPIEKVVLTLDENHFDGKILTHELDKCEEVGKYLYNPIREGYIFRGWNTKADGSGDFVKASDLICESKTIYAIWEKEAVEHHHEYVPTLPVYADASKKDKVRPSESHSAYIFGYEDKSVRANNNLTRAEAAAMVTRLAKLDLSNKAKADYKDLQDKAWYLPYINAALKAGMIDADGENLRPNDKITRAEFAKMLAAIDKENDYVSKFQDVKGHKYEKEINKIDGNKRIAGYEDGTFRPDDNLTRAEAASFLNRMFNRVADDAAIRNLEDSLVKFTDLNKGDWFYYEIVEAANSHELVRRDGSDKYDRVYESWLRLIDNGITR